MGPISPPWDPCLKDVSPADHQSGVCSLCVVICCVFDSWQDGIHLIFFLSTIRFSTEDVSVSTPDKKPKPTTPTPALHRNSADWLGLKTKDDNAYLEEETKTSTESPNAPSSPFLERKPSLTGAQATSTARTAAESPAPAKQTRPEVSTTQKKEEEEEDDWLAGVLSRKKTVSASNPEATKTKQEDFSDQGEELDLESFVRYCGSQTLQHIYSAETEETC